ncbi:hypothetical protein BKA24_001738 [Microbacterium marinum]|uniref:Uncharacterized protein n=1 Tax=Microbacterium marinum TaxID=421115 RepID=A0A7W7FL45_9MICO|nr:hypothetical protein [Microbacterium marinum]MBB4667029.1 hypothetical protein [Microbacterium marinum]
MALTTAEAIDALILSLPIKDERDIWRIEIVGTGVVRLYTVDRAVTSLPGRELARHDFDAWGHPTGNAVLPDDPAANRVIVGFDPAAEESEETATEAPSAPQGTLAVGVIAATGAAQAVAGAINAAADAEKAAAADAVRNQDVTA